MSVRPCSPPAGGAVRLIGVLGVALFTMLGLAGHPGAAGADSTATRTPAVESVPVAAPPGQGFPARADYVAEVRREFTPESREYARIRQALAFADPVWQIAVAALLLFSGLSARMRDLAHRLFRRRYGRVFVYFALFNVAAFVLDFPLAWYRGFSLEHRFGLSNQGFLQWFGEQGKDLLVGTLVLGGTGLLVLAYRAIERSPRRWWLWLGAGSFPVILAMVLLQPLVFDPLYNDFTRLKDRQLETKILALAGRAGIPARNVYEVDRSRQTKKYNAYVSGFGASQRIVLWDTTLQGMKEDEILFVMAHEMGHYKLAHIWKGVAFYSLLCFLLFFLSARIMGAAVARFGPRWGFRDLHDIASLPLFAATLSLVLFAAQPLTNSFSRTLERESDTFGLEVVRDNDAAARAFLKLGSQNRSDPEPPAIVKIFQYTHPPLVERVAFAESYRPWAEGKPNRLFKPGD